MESESINKTRRDIVNKLSVLEYVIGLNGHRLYATSESFNPGNVDSVRHEAELMLAHVGISGYKPVISFHHEEKENVAGHIELNDNDNKEVVINISASEIGDNVSVLCILAHEICHKVLHLKKFKALSVNENEVYADLAAIYCGFGRQMLNGCYEKKQSWTPAGTTMFSVSQTKTIGYMKFEDYAFAYLLMCSFYGISGLEYKAGLDSESLEVLSKLESPALKMRSFEDKIQADRKDCANLIREIAFVDAKLREMKLAVAARLNKIDYEHDLKDAQGGFRKPVSAYSLLLEDSLSEEISATATIADSIDGVKDVRQLNRIFCPYCGADIDVPRGIKAEDYTNFMCYSCRKVFMVSLQRPQPLKQNFWKSLFGKE